ncbi:MAG: TraM recognition domain-containing protein [Phycisphaeraceae bacterium]|nr:TraM recognition domain-containing protein [Phycisphaeraceae bacterium]MCB9848144.1 TraM recognition domain-containing protein [Phycisphaeraceae bacterium]
MRIGASVVLTSFKPDDSERFLRQAASAGRQDDVRVLRVGGFAFNPLAFEQERCQTAGGRLESLVSLITLPLERQRRFGAGGDPHWKVAAADLVRSLCVIYAAAGVKLSFRLIHETITSLPMCEDDVHDPFWQSRCPAYAAIQQANRSELPDTEAQQLDMAARHILQTVPATPQKTMMSIVQTLSSSLSPLLYGELGEIINADQDTWSPLSVVESSEVTVIDIPVQGWGPSGAVLQRMILTATQREIIRRRPDQITPPMIVLSCDEFPGICDPEDDLKFLVTCRDRAACMILGIQSLSSLRLALHDATGARAAEAVMGAPGIKLFGASSDPDTLDAASRVFSVVPTPRISFGSNSQDGPVGDGHRPRKPGHSFNYSSSMDPDITGRDLLCLKTGGEHNHFICEFYCSVTGRTWKSSGKSSLKVGIRQRFD